MNMRHVLLGVALGALISAPWAGWRLALLGSGIFLALFVGLSYILSRENRSKP